MRYLIVIENTGSNYSAYSPDLPGCVATGATPEETKAQMQEAVTMHLAGLREDGLPLPAPAAIGETIEVGV